jgi:hypothetical protein
MRNLPFVVSSILAVAVALYAVPVDARTLTGTVTFEGHRTQAFVLAAPIDTVTGTPDESRAIKRMTGLNGAFSVPVPDGPCVLIGWNGRSTAVAFDPADRTELVLSHRDKPDAVVAATEPTCTCKKWFWNFYYSCYHYWFGTDCWVSWGCAC